MAGRLVRPPQSPIRQSQKQETLDYYLATNVAKCWTDAPPRAQCRNNGENWKREKILNQSHHYCSDKNFEVDEKKNMQKAFMEYFFSIRNLLSRKPRTSWPRSGMWNPKDEDKVISTETPARSRALTDRGRTLTSFHRIRMASSLPVKSDTTGKIHLLIKFFSFFIISS